MRYLVWKQVQCCDAMQLAALLVVNAFVSVERALQIKLASVGAPAFPTGSLPVQLSNRAKSACFCYLKTLLWEKKTGCL